MITLCRIVLCDRSSLEQQAPIELTRVLRMNHLQVDNVLLRASMVLGGRGESWGISIATAIAGGAGIINETN